MDNNVLDNIYSMPERDEVLSVLSDSRSTGKCQYYIPEEGFWELLQGFSENSFRMFQGVLKRTWELTEGRILLGSTDHLKYSIGIIDRQRCENRYRELIGELRVATLSPDYATFQIHLGKKAEVIRQWNSEQLKLSIPLQDEMHRFRNEHGVQSARKEYSLNDSDLFFQRYGVFLLKRFDLIDRYKNVPPNQIAEELPSIRQMCEIYRVFYLMIVDGMKFDSGDYFDLQRVPYLDLCDYIVSNDKPYRRLFARADGLDLDGRAISIESLASQIAESTLVPRSTSNKWSNCSEYWIAHT